MALLISSRHDPYSMRRHCTGEMVNNSRDEGPNISQRYGPRGRTAPLSEIECPSLDGETNSVANIRRPVVAFLFLSLSSSRLYLGSSTDFLFLVFYPYRAFFDKTPPPTPPLFVLPLTAACITTPISLITRSITAFFSSQVFTLLFTLLQKCLPSQTLRPVAALPARTPSSPVLPGRCLDSSAPFIADICLVALALRRPSSLPRRVLPFSCLIFLSLLLKRLLPRSSSSSPTLPASRSL